MKNFGYYSTPNPTGIYPRYLIWYRKRPEDMEHGLITAADFRKPAGYLRVCKESRNWFETDFPNWLKEPAKNSNWKIVPVNMIAISLRVWRPAGYTGPL